MSYYNKAQILKIVQECGYPKTFQDQIAYFIYEIMTNFKNTKIQKCTRQNENMIDTVIIFLIFYVPTTLKDKMYELPIIIYFPQGFPAVAPELYVQRTSSEIAINEKNTDIDPQTFRIITGSLKTWNTYSQMSTVVSEVINSFNTNFPVYNKAKSSSSSSVSTATATTTSTGGRGSGGYSSGGYPSGGYSSGGQGQGMIFQQNTGYTGGGNQQSAGYINPLQVQPSTGTQSAGYALRTTKTIYNDLNIGGNTNTNTNINTNTNTNTFSPQGFNQGMGGNINPGYTGINISNEDPEQGIKYILLNETKTKLAKKVQEEIKHLKKEEDTINNYKNEMARHLTLFNNVISQKDTLNNPCLMLDNEIREVYAYIQKNKNNVINSSNLETYIQVKDSDAIKAIAMEASIEDFIAVAKRSFEKKALEFQDTVRLIRSITREQFKVKYYKDKLLRSIAQQ